MALRRRGNRVANFFDSFNQAYDTVDKVVEGSRLADVADAQVQEAAPVEEVVFRQPSATEGNGPPSIGLARIGGPTANGNLQQPDASAEAGNASPVQSVGLTRIDVPSGAADDSADGGGPSQPPLVGTNRLVSPKQYRFLGKTYDTPLSEGEQAAARNAAAADIVARRDPAIAARMRMLGAEGKKLAQEDADQAALRAAWNTPDAPGLPRIFPAQPSQASASQQDASGVSATQSPPVAAANPGNLAAADVAVRRADGRDAANAYYSRKAPAVIDAYLRTGQTEKAKHLRDFLDSEDGRAYTQEWSHGVRLITAGDYQGALTSFQRLYNSQRVPDGNTIKLTPVGDGSQFKADVVGPNGQLVNTIPPAPISNLAKSAGMALAPEKMAEFMAKSEEQRARESGQLDRQIALETIRQDGQNSREDRRDQRLDTRLEAQSDMLDRRLAGRGEFSTSQQRINDSIDGARQRLAGMSKTDVLAVTQAATATGRPNPNYDPQMASIVRIANTRKYGDDPAHDAFSASRSAGAQPSQADPLQTRFSRDPKVAGNRLGGIDAKNGLRQVLDASGKVVGHYE